MRHLVAWTAALGLSAILAGSAYGSTIIYNNLTPNNMMGIATRPDLPGSFEIEAGDDFVASLPVMITSASFVGLEVGGAASPSVQDLVAEIYRVFPNDSNVGRTSGPPTFSTPQVPTRVNSPSDVAFDSRDSASPGNLTFTTTVLNSNFVVQNSIQPGGIHPTTGQATGGNGPLTGQEVEFDVTFTTPIVLPADHYFFVPQVALSGGDQFYWLSASRPVSGLDINGNPTTPFPAGSTDLQAWTRDAMLDPDWLRVGTDIVDTVNVPTAPTFNAAFSLSGTVTPEPASILGVGIGLGLIAYMRSRNIHRRISSSRVN